MPFKSNFASQEPRKYPQPFQRVVVSTFAPTAAATGEARNDDVEDGDEAINNGGEDLTDAVHNSHEACADGLKDGLDLQGHRAR
ncbi:MAG: hypothetical protein Q9196_006354 [Gyalolechia fulgens]